MIKTKNRICVKNDIILNSIKCFKGVQKDTEIKELPVRFSSIGVANPSARIMSVEERWVQIVSRVKI